jgi:hypothetical protein
MKSSWKFYPYNENDCKIETKSLLDLIIKLLAFIILLDEYHIRIGSLSVIENCLFSQRTFALTGNINLKLFFYK